MLVNPLSLIGVPVYISASTGKRLLSVDALQVIQQPRSLGRMLTVAGRRRIRCVRIILITLILMILMIHRGLRLLTDEIVTL